MEEEEYAVLESICFIERAMVQKMFDQTENAKCLYREYLEAVIVLYYESNMAVTPAEMYLEKIDGWMEIVDYYEKLWPLRILEMLNSDKRGGQFGTVISFLLKLALLSR